MGKVAWKKVPLFYLGGCMGCSKQCQWNAAVTSSSNSHATKYTCNADVEEVKDVTRKSIR